MAVGGGTPQGRLGQESRARWDRCKGGGHERRRLQRQHSEVSQAGSMLEAVNPRSPAGLDRGGPPFDLALDELGEIFRRGAGLAPSLTSTILSFRRLRAPIFMPHLAPFAHWVQRYVRKVTSATRASIRAIITLSGYSRWGQN